MTTHQRSTVGGYDLSKFGTIQQALLEPFDDDQISEIDGFSYVDPYHYFMRWHSVFVNGFTFKVHEVKYGDSAMTAQAYFKAQVDDVEFEIEVPCAEKYIKARETGDVLKLEQSQNMLTSAGCKNVSRAIGLGLHLYSKPAKRDGSKKGGGSSNGSSNGASNGAASSAPAQHDGEWTGDQLIGGGGKFKHLKWNDPQVDDGYITFCVGKFGPNSNAGKEQARRAANNVQDGQAKGAAAVNKPGGVPF